MSGEADTEAERIFNIIDTDKSGEIDGSELLTHLLAAGVDADEISRTFAAIDTDGDGAITRDEWRAGYARYAALNAVDDAVMRTAVAALDAMIAEHAAMAASYSMGAGYSLPQRTRVRARSCHRAYSLAVPPPTSFLSLSSAWCSAPSPLAVLRGRAPTSRWCPSS